MRIQNFIEFKRINEAQLRRYGRFQDQITRELDEKMNEMGLEGSIQIDTRGVWVHFHIDKDVHLTLIGKSANMGKIYSFSLGKWEGDTMTPIALENPEDLDLSLKQVRKAIKDHK